MEASQFRPKTNIKFLCQSKTLTADLGYVYDDPCSNTQRLPQVSSRALLGEDKLKKSLADGLQTQFNSQWESEKEVMKYVDIEQTKYAKANQNSLRSLYKKAQVKKMSAENRIKFYNLHSLREVKDDNYMT